MNSNDTSQLNTIKTLWTINTVQYQAMSCTEQKIWLCVLNNSFPDKYSNGSFKYSQLLCIACYKYKNSHWHFPHDIFQVLLQHDVFNYWEPLPWVLTIHKLASNVKPRDLYRTTVHVSLWHGTYSSLGQMCQLQYIQPQGHKSNPSKMLTITFTQLGVTCPIKTGFSWKMSQYWNTVLYMPNHV